MRAASLPAWLGLVSTSSGPARPVEWPRRPGRVAPPAEPGAPLQVLGVAVALSPAGAARQAACGWLPRWRPPQGRVEPALGFLDEIDADELEGVTRGRWLVARITTAAVAEIPACARAPRPACRLPQTPSAIGTLPASVNRPNAKHYRTSSARTEFHEFDGRSHWTCGEPGWDYALDWALEHAIAP